MSQGWISVHRSMLDHHFWHGEKFTKGQAWIDLILNANHKENKVMIKGRLIVVARGEQIRSKVTLAKTWKWNERTVSKFLELLKSDGMITTKSTELTTHITICNYSTFQDINKNSAERNTQHTTEQSAEAVHSTVQTNNNDNNANNVNNDNKKPVPAKKKKQQEIVAIEYPINLNKEAWIEWIDHRKQSRLKKLTQKGEVLAMKNLVAMGDAQMQRSIIEQSMANGWQGLFLLKKQSQGQQAEKGNIMDWVHGAKKEEKLIN